MPSGAGAPQPCRPRGARRHFAGEKAHPCCLAKFSRPSTTCPPTVHADGQKHSQGGKPERLLHSRTGRTVKPSRGNAARARRETGRPSGRDAPGPKDRRETFGDRTGSGSSRTGRKSGHQAIQDLQTAAPARVLGERAMRPGDRKYRPLARLGLPAFGTAPPVPTDRPCECRLTAGRRIV